ncbi:B domain of TMEM189, localisation domain [Trichlorobacter thiogenes]|uniref:B domain of TMEM189, localisation domain n=1 Tax=Trichlorobacter thiogenes TaxID=115783 RepID=A0A1T4MX09_9BACT|nr:fatty acid desaturase CarF family protein [Trichlorobacter thiogenes]SJZ71589.1 B domain of TMEM189, localisation domain [Trichlorobacter thiogenes]
MEISTKQEQFNAAMALYSSQSRYRVFGLLVSTTNISLQIYLLYRIWPVSIGPVWQVFSIGAAYLLTDFINGLVHMYMDNNDRYESLDGPLIANFHLHHKTPQYQKHNLLMVYFTETGSKVWLVGYLLLIAVLQALFVINPAVLYTLVYIGILSSVAEVSHYLCHSSTSPTTAFLAKIGLLLSKRHHAQHHLRDNNGYAFLNGFTDPVLDLIAAACCKGYKQQTDLHYAHYHAADVEAR